MINKDKVNTDFTDTHGGKSVLLREIRGEILLLNCGREYGADERS